MFDQRQQKSETAEPLPRTFALRFRKTQRQFMKAPVFVVDGECVCRLRLQQSEEWGCGLTGKSIKKWTRPKGRRRGRGWGGGGDQKERVHVCECVSVCAPFKLLRWERVPDGAVQSAIT